MRVAAGALKMVWLLLKMLIIWGYRGVVIAIRAVTTGRFVADKPEGAGEADATQQPGDETQAAVSYSVPKPIIEQHGQDDPDYSLPFALKDMDHPDAP